MELKVRNVNQAVEEALWLFKTSAVRETSRNGEVLVLPEPLMTTYERPTERVLFWPERDANPIFHLMESIWMLAGRDDVKFVEYFNSRMRNFSDDGVVLNGAYGHRWRRRFGMDQLVALILHLEENHDTRRAVLTMWTPGADLALMDESKDVCCNTQVFFDRRGGVLNMTVLNRSNDIIWGAYGANAVHFSVLQEFIACALRIPVGVYRQFSNNAHLYTELYDYGKYVESPPSSELFDYYSRGVRPAKLFSNGNWEEFLTECEEFCEAPFVGRRYKHSFFSDVAHPMAMVVRERKEKTSDGREWVNRVSAEDWRLAVRQWIDRREAKNAA